LAFFTTPYIVHKLGADAYGVLSIVSVAIGYFGFLDLGLGQATIKYVSEYYAKKDFKTIREIIGTSLVVYCIMGFVGAVILASLTGILVTRVLKIPPNLINTSFFAFYISALGFLINMPLNVFGSIPGALQRFDIINKIGICIGTIQTGLTVLLLYLGYSLKQIIVMNLLISILSVSIYLIVSKKLLPQIQIKPAFSKTMFGKLFKFGGFLTIGRLTIPIGTELGKFLIGIFHPISFVTYFTIPYTLASKLWAIPSSIISAIFPATSELFSRNQAKILQELHLRSTKYVMAVVVPISVLLIVFAKEILGLWMGPDFAVKSAFSLRILASAILISCSAQTSVIAARGAGRPDIPAKIQVLQAVINIALCFLLIPRWGINGIAMAWLVHHIVCMPMIIGITNRQIVKISNLRFIKDGLVTPLILGGIIPCLLIPLRSFMSGLKELLVLFIFVGIIYTIIAYFVILDVKDRSIALDYLHKIVGKPS